MQIILKQYQCDNVFLPHNKGTDYFPNFQIYFTKKIKVTSQQPLSIPKHTYMNGTKLFKKHNHHTFLHIHL